MGESVREAEPIIMRASICIAKQQVCQIYKHSRSNIVIVLIWPDPWWVGSELLGFIMGWVVFMDRGLGNVATLVKSTHH
jgi:hypothetical protein